MKSVLPPLNDMPPLKKVSMMHGWYWIRDGFGLFRERWPMWLGLAGLYLVLMTFLNVIPVVGSLLSLLLYPVFLAGFLRAASRQVREKTFTFNVLFDGFKTQPVSLGMLSVYVFTANLGILVLMVMLVATGTQSPNVMWNEASTYTEVLCSLFGLRIVWAGVIFGAIGVVWLALWLAPCLVVFRGETPLNALRGSLRVAWHNLSAVMMFAGLSGMLGILAWVPYGMGVFVWLPCMCLSLFVAYREVFDDVDPLPVVEEDGDIYVL